MSQKTDNDGWNFIPYKKDRITRKERKQKQKRNQNRNSRNNQNANSDNRDVGYSYRQPRHVAYDDSQDNVVLQKYRRSYNPRKDGITSRPKQTWSTTKSGKSASKVENDNDTYKSKTLRDSVRRVITNVRTTKKLTRGQLAQMLNVKEAVISEYEYGNPIPDNQLLRDMERILKVRLRGKNDVIGNRIR